MKNTVFNLSKSACEVCICIQVWHQRKATESVLSNLVGFLSVVIIDVDVLVFSCL